MAAIDDVEELVHRRPGLTEVGLSEELLGPGARQQRVNPSCRRLAKAGRVERRGKSGIGKPFTYYPMIKGEGR